jgi:hypothetical protein
MWAAPENLRPIGDQVLGIGRLLANGGPGGAGRGKRRNNRGNQARSAEEFPAGQFNFLVFDLTNNSE